MTKDSPRGMVPAINIGWRRPNLVRKRSDHDPINGSDTASHITLMNIAKPVKVPDNPNTCL
jgi:hypothetical protein